LVLALRERVSVACAGFPLAGDFWSGGLCKQAVMVHSAQVMEVTFDLIKDVV